MTVESSTPEAAAASERKVRGVIERELHNHYLTKGTDTADRTAAGCIMRALSAAGFTVVSGGEGLQHELALLRVVAERAERAREVERTRAVAPFAHRELDEAIAAWRSAAPGTTAEPRDGAEDVAGRARKSTLADPGTGHAARPVATAALASGATAPAACPDCKGTRRVRTSWRDPRPSPCWSCGGSGVAETTP